MAEPAAATVLIAAGGTGGHVFPGLATAAALREAWPAATVEFVGTADRLEARLVPEAGWALHTVPAMALARRASPAALKLPFVLAGAVRRVARLIRERDVAVAVGFGGYTSVPLALAARLTRTPLVVHEQNAVPGVANRLAARAAAVVAVSFEQARAGFGATRTVLTGNPIRPDLLPAPAGADGPTLRAARDGLRGTARTTFGLDPDRRTLLVFGGSQGALRINAALTGSAARWGDPGGLQVLHAAGRRTAEATRQGWLDAGVDPDGHAEPGRLKVVCVEFIQRMDLAYAAADVVVCRAGASSIAELTALAIPAVLVPYPHATADHQTANARAVEAAGGAVVVADADLDAAALVAAAEPILTDAARHAELVGGSASFGRPHAAADLAALVLEAAR
jgi:UDP-N-acetylglucosamine--N-acetylmuramyl-(pentapeptide) pyrophosphoryl-undecaprenol N-acetylglucosamine transferase